MNIDTDTINKIAHLARLTFSEEKTEELKTDMEKILSFMRKLDEVDTEGVEPLIYLSEEQNILREDKVIQIISHEDALKNAPKHDSDFFRVPKVIDI